MTGRFHPPLPESGAMRALLIEAARCWREARDKRQPVQPNLFALLSRYGYGMLAPVFDSLMTLTEGVSGRRIATGIGPVLSEDECRLVDLFERDGDCQHAEGLVASLDCAVASLRLMLMRGCKPAHSPAV